MILGLLPLVLAAGDPAVRLWIDHDGRFAPGEYARVQVQTRDPGYLLVLQATPDGGLRVLFPLSPGDNNFVRGGERYELRDQDGREGFAISSGAGRGMVYAAVSSSPFRFDDFRRIDAWDYSALAPTRLPQEPETELTELVRQMAQVDFDYDLLSYEVMEQRDYASGSDTSHTFESDEVGYGGFGFPFFFRCGADPFFRCAVFFDPLRREPRLITRFSPRRVVPGASREGLREWPLDVSPGSPALTRMAGRAGWPTDVSPRHLSSVARVGPRVLSRPGIEPRAQMDPGRQFGMPARSGRVGLEPAPDGSPGLRSFVPHPLPALHGGLTPTPR